MPDSRTTGTPDAVAGSIDGMALKDRLKLAMESADPPVTQADLARACNISRASVSSWISGQTKEISGPNLVTAATRLGVNEKWLSHGLPPMRRKDTVENYSVKPDIRRLPKIGWPTLNELSSTRNSAAEWSAALEVAGSTEGFIVVSAERAGPTSFVVAAVGDSMYPEVRAGDDVVIDPEVNPQDGDLVLARRQDGSWLIRWLVDDYGRKSLVAENSSYQAEPIDGLAIIGKVVAVQRTPTRHR